MADIERATPESGPRVGETVRVTSHAGANGSENVEVVRQNQSEVPEASGSQGLTQDDSAEEGMSTTGRPSKHTEEPFGQPSEEVTGNWPYATDMAPSYAAQQQQYPQHDRQLAKDATVGMKPSA